MKVKEIDKVYTPGYEVAMRVIEAGGDYYIGAGLPEDGMDVVGDLSQYKVYPIDKFSDKRQAQSHWCIMLQHAFYLNPEYGENIERVVKESSERAQRVFENE
jgi:hypothetical protein